MFTKRLNTLMFSVSLVHLSWNIPPSVNMQVVLNLYAVYSLVKVKVTSHVCSRNRPGQPNLKIYCTLRRRIQKIFTKYNGKVMEIEEVDKTCFTPSPILHPPHAHVPH